MMKQPPPTRGLETIDHARLDTVTGGRIIPRKGTDPGLLQGITELTKIIAELNKQSDAKKQASMKEMMGMLQQFMDKKKGGK